MKKLLLPILLLTFALTNSQTPCDNGMAGAFPCNGYDLQANITLSQMNASFGNDSWGWTDPDNGNEYALMGLDNGTGFIDITDPVNPVYLGKLPTHTSSSSWRDIKVFNNHAFVVSEAGGHGMQVFDLTRLRDVTNPPQTFTEDAHFGGFGSAHNIVINEDSGFAYPVGANRSVFPFGGPIFIDISDPINPQLAGAGGYAMDAYSHDAQVVTYCGPDSDYTGREILIGSNEDEVVIVDITDKNDPQRISEISYTNVGYTHQGWFTEDQRFFILGDETDELNFGFDTKTIVFDFEDLDNPSFSFNYTGPSAASDHNGYVKGTKYYMANYRAGMRAIDVSDIANGTMTEEGFFDTSPANNNVGTSAAWNVFPYFDSGNIVISDTSRGFFLVKAAAGDTTAPIANCKDATVILGEDGTGTLTASDINDNSSDDSGEVFFTLCDTNFDCADLGTRTVDLEVYDAFGNRDICSATVTIVDSTDPVSTCPEELTVEYDSGNEFYTVPSYENDGIVTVSDNCLELNTVQTPAIGTELTVGTYTVSFETTDASGNTSTCSFPLSVRSTLGTNDLIFENGLSLYPNPTNNSINISSATEAINAVNIVDITGKVLYSNTNINTTETIVDVSAFSTGIYFVNINGTVSKKIIKK